MMPRKMQGEDRPPKRDQKEMVPPHRTNTLFLNAFPRPLTLTSTLFPYLNCPPASCRVRPDPLDKGGYLGGQTCAQQIDFRPSL